MTDKEKDTQIISFPCTEIGQIRKHFVLYSGRAKEDGSKATILPTISDPQSQEDLETLNKEWGNFFQSFYVQNPPILWYLQLASKEASDTKSLAFTWKKWKTTPLELIAGIHFNGWKIIVESFDASKTYSIGFRVPPREFEDTIKDSIEGIYEYWIDPHNNEEYWFSVPYEQILEAVFAPPEQHCI